MNESATRSEIWGDVISRVTNPCILSVLVLLLIAGTESGNLRDFVGSAMVLLLFLVLLPLFYVYMRTIRSHNDEKFTTVPTVFLKHRPKDVLVLGLITGLPCFIILLFLDAPSRLLATLVVLLAISVAVALSNLFYRVSYHLAAVTVLVIIAALTWGWIYFVLLVFLPVIAWAKYRVREHTLPQVAIGIAVAVVVSGVILYFYN
jgi:hypothetical protein